jgi:hypothetical protein
MARLKRIVKSALEDRSPRFLLATIALGVAISLVAGMAIGYRVEQSRAKPPKRIAATGKPRTTGAARTTAIKAAPDLTGAVFSPVKKNVLVVVYGDKKSVHFTLGAKTRIAVAKPAKASSITVGSRVLFQPSSASPTTATEVVVLPAAALIGIPVTAVVPGTSMTLKSLTKSSGVVIKTTGVPVYKTGPGASPSIAKRDRVVVRFFRIGTGAKRRAAVVEIVVLPPTSKFR